jgi:NAD-dependent oxidoreductase involved in siderophore biosynthesis
MMSETFRNYFTDEQIAALQQRRTQLGEDYIESVENEWPGLIDSARAEMAAGTDPAAPEVQALAKRWMELMEAFDGGDAGLREANARMFRERSEDIASQAAPRR